MRSLDCISGWKRLPLSSSHPYPLSLTCDLDSGGVFGGGLYAMVVGYMCICGTVGDNKSMQQDRIRIYIVSLRSIYESVPIMDSPHKNIAGIGVFRVQTR